MNYQKGFVLLPILVAVLLMGAIGGGTYFVIKEQASNKDAIADFEANISKDTVPSIETTGRTSTTSLLEAKTEASTKTEEKKNVSSLGDADHEAGFVLNVFYTDTCPFITYDMALGSTDAGTGGQVSKLQYFLREQNANIEPTGYFGTETVDAVAKWQKYIGFSSQIKNAGTVGAITRQNMNNQCRVGASAFPKLGKLYVTPKGTPTVKIPEGWTAKSISDYPLIRSTKIETRTVVTASDQKRYRVISYQLFAAPESVTGTSLETFVEEALNIHADTKMLNTKTFNKYGLAITEFLFEGKSILPDAEHQIMARVFYIPGYIVVVGGSTNKAVTPDFDVVGWYDKVFDSLVLPSIFSAYPNGVPVASYVSLFKELDNKVRAMKAVPQGVESDFYLSACYPITSDLFVGDFDASTNGQVSLLQKMLFEKYKVSPSIITGRFDDLTLLQVIRFQREMGLEGTGGIGVKTRAALSRCKFSP